MATDFFYNGPYNTQAVWRSVLEKLVEEHRGGGLLAGTQGKDVFIGIKNDQQVLLPIILPASAAWPESLLLCSYPKGDGYDRREIGGYS